MIWLVSLCVYLSIYLSVCLSVCLSFYMLHKPSYLSHVLSVVGQHDNAVVSAARLLHSLKPNRTIDPIAGRMGGYSDESS